MEADEQSLKILPNYLLIDSDKKYLIEDRFASSLLQFVSCFQRRHGCVLQCTVTAFAQACVHVELRPPLGWHASPPLLAGQPRCPAQPPAPQA